MQCIDCFNPHQHMKGAAKVNYGQDKKIYCGTLNMDFTGAMRVGVVVESDLVGVGLLDPRPIINARAGTLIDQGWKFRFEVKSKQTGGLSSCDCGFDPSPYDAVHVKRKVGGLPLIYSHVRECPKQYVGTELEPVFYQPNSATPQLNNDYTLAVLANMVAAVQGSFSKTAVLGVKGSAQRDITHFYGIIAQAWFASQNAYYNSVKYTVDSAEFVDGKKLAVRIGGEVKVFTFDSAVTSEPGYNPSIDGVVATATYSTAAGVFNAVCTWINSRVSPGGLRFYEAQSFGFDIFITHKHVGEIVDCRFQVLAADQSADWLVSPSCDHVTYTVIQAPMPIDDRPIILPYTPITQYNAYDVLHDALYHYNMQLKQEDLWNYTENGVPSTPLRVKMFCDKNIHTMWVASQRRQEKPIELMIQRENGVSEPIEMVPLTQLENTGLFFFTTENNMVALIDAEQGKPAFIQQAPEWADEIAGTFNYGFEMLGMVTAKRFSTIGINLGCNHPFLNHLQGHVADNDTACCIPCLQPEIVKCAIPATNPCHIKPGFCVKIVTVDAKAGEYKLVIESTAVGFDTSQPISVSYTGTFANGAQTVLTFTANAETVEIPFYTTAFNGLSASITQTITNGNCTESITKTIGTSPSADFTPTNVVLFGFDAVIGSDGTTLAIVGQSDLGLDEWAATASVIYTITDGSNNEECITVNGGEDVAPISIAAIGGGSLVTSSGLTITATYQTDGGLGGNGDGSQSCGSVDSNAIDMYVTIADVEDGTYAATHP